MLETIVVVGIVVVAGLWFVRWFKGTASGEGGCACQGGCGKKDCPSKQQG